MKFPKEAEPVRKYIRDNVKRPKRLPSKNRDSGRLRWGSIQGTGRCPMGLLPKANISAPAAFQMLPSTPFDEKAFLAFIDFWDKCTDPQYAVDQVWGNAETT